MHASTPLILRKSRMRRRARTDLRGGRSAMVVPTATVVRPVIQFHLRGKFYKGRSQEKTLLLRLEFFLLLSPYDRARSVLTYRAMCWVAGHCAPAVWVFSTSGFHRFLATKPVCSETSKAERSQIWRP